MRLTDVAVFSPGSRANVLKCEARVTAMLPGVRAAGSFWG
jgi:hypothetical protein